SMRQLAAALSSIPRDSGVPGILMLSFLVPALLFLAVSPCHADPPDGITLTLHHGPMLGQVTLDWTGGSPVYEVYRAASPVQVVAAANKLGETNSPTWTDVPPPGGAHFYLVALRSNHPPVLSSIGNRTAPQGQTLTFVVSATDPDGDPLTLTV